MGFKTKNRHRLKTKEIKEIQTNLQKSFIYPFFDNKSSVESCEIEGMNIILVDNKPCFMIIDSRVFFTLYGIEKFKPKEKFVVVDMGAVKFVTSGADVMAPGIIDADVNICENDQVWICDERHHKPLAIGIAILNGDEMKSNRKGKAVKVIHYVGDKLWIKTSKGL